MRQLTFCSLLIVTFLLSVSSLNAQTSWSAGSVTVTDLLTEENWSNGLPTKANPGTITNATVTDSALFKPAGTVNGDVDLTFGQDSVINLSGGFIPFADLNGTGPALFNLTLTGNAKLNVTGNYWGGNNNSGPKGQLEGETYTANYTFGGESVTTVNGEWWIGMSAKSHIIVKDSAQVISTKGNSGIGWGGQSANSLMEIQGGLVKAPTFFIGQGSSNQTLQQTGGELNVTNLNFISAPSDGSIPNADLNRKYLMSGADSKLTVTGTLYNSGLIEMKDEATATVATYTGKGKLTVKDSAKMTVATYNSVGTQESIEKDGILNVTNFYAKSGDFGINGGTVTAKNIYVGTVANSTGAITLSTGELKITNDFIMGNTENATGTFTQTGGTWNYTGTDRGDPRILLSTQSGAKSVMNLSGGNFNLAGTFYMADNDSGTAEVNISGTAALSTKEVRVGQHGTATVNMSAGTWTTNGSTFIIGHQDSAAHGIVKLSGTAELTTGNFRLAYTGVGDADASTGELEMSGTSKLTVNGTFVPFENAQKANAKGLAKVTLSDKAQLYVSGNFWGGNNSHEKYAAPREGNDYAAYYTFGGESSLSCAEWWVAMSAKTYVLIKDSATVTSRSGNSGLGWGGGAAGSLLEQTGGTLISPSFYIGQGTSSSVSLSGGETKLTTLYLGANAGSAGTLNISANGHLTTTTLSLGGVGTGDLTMTGGTADVTTLRVATGAGAANLTLNGDAAKLNVGGLEVGNSTGAVTLDIQKGTLSVTSSANIANNSGPVTITQSGGTFNSSVDVEAARAAGSSLTMNLSGGEFKTKEFRVATKGTAEINLSGSANLHTTGAFYPAFNSTANEVVSTTLNMSGNSKLTVDASGAAFVPFRGNATNSHKGAGYFSMTLDENANVYVNGNFWGGSDSENAAAVPEGKQYAQELVFKGNSTFSCGEWWVAMSAKSHILIAENASVTSRSGNAGLAWSANANGSLLEMTGGKLTALTFKNGNNDSNYGTVRQTGGTSTFNALENYKLSTLELGGTAKMQANSLKNNGTVTLSGGDLYLTTLTNTGTLTVEPSGSLQVGTIGATKAETLTISGADKIAMNGQIVLDLFPDKSTDQLSFTDGKKFTYGDSAVLGLNLIDAEAYSPTETYSLQVADWATDLKNVKILGRDDFIGVKDGNTVIFGSTNALPEPATWALLILGTFGLLWLKRRV